ncbi:MAG: hypothetical protein AMS18_08770, partial [Gemmatimonas sp. SG8_17]
MPATYFASPMRTVLLLAAILGLGACSESGCSDCGPFATQWRELDAPMPTPRRALTGSIVVTDAFAYELYV